MMKKFINTRQHDRPDLRAALESAGFLVFDASGGGQDLERLREFWAALILLDLPSPRMTGLEIVRYLRGAGESDPEGIVVMQGRTPDAVAAMRLGSVDVLARPLTPEALRNVVEKIAHAADGSQSRSTGPKILVAVDPLAFDLLRAKRALNRREFAEARRLLRDVIDLDPDSAVAHNLMGLLHENLGECHAAYRSFHAALKADRRYEPALENLRLYCKFVGIDFDDRLFELMEKPGNPPIRPSRSSA